MILKPKEPVDLLIWRDPSTSVGRGGEKDLKKEKRPTGRKIKKKSKVGGAENQNRRRYIHIPFDLVDTDQSIRVYRMETAREYCTE